MKYMLPIANTCNDVNSYPESYRKLQREIVIGKYKIVIESINFLKPSLIMIFNEKIF